MTAKTIKRTIGNAGIVLVLPIVLSMCGCRAFRGPVWSPLGNKLAYTVNRLSPKSETAASDLYLLDTRAQTPEPRLLAKAANFPQWSPDGQSLYFLGKKNNKGFYTALYRHRPLGRTDGSGTFENIFDSGNLKFVDFQLSETGHRALLCSARNATPGAGRNVELMDMRNFNLKKLSQIGEVYAPVLSPDGQTLAYVKKGKAAGSRPFVVVLELNQKSLQEFSIFPTEEYEELGATTFVLHAFPDSKQFLFYAPGGKALWTARLGGKLNRFSLPEGYTSPWMVSIAPDSRKAFVTLAHMEHGELRYDVFELRFSGGKYTLLEGGAKELIGGNAIAPGSSSKKGTARSAWISSAGLALGGTGPTLYFPQNREQLLAASRIYRQGGDPKGALDAIQKARGLKPPPQDPTPLNEEEALALLADGEGEKAAELFTRTYLSYPVGRTGLTYLFPTGKNLPKLPHTEQHALLAKLTKFSAAAPEDTLLKHVTEALSHRLKGDHDAAEVSYRSATNACSDEAMAGGISFLEAMRAFEVGKLQLAGEKWESAARSKNFPQADYAAGLSHIAHALDVRPESEERASEILKRGLDMGTPLAADLKKLTGELRDKAYKLSRVSAERKSPDLSLRTWVDIHEYVMPQAYLLPQDVFICTREYDRRRICAALQTLSEIQVAGLAEGPKTLARIPHAITVPDFSPSGELLSFLVMGSVFPLKDAFCKMFVIDLNGSLILGDAATLTARSIQGRQIISKAVWAGPGEVQINGFQVDGFGNKTGLQKTVRIATP